jgi:hypothetical protein
LVLTEIDVLDPQAQAFHEPQPRAVQEAGHELLVAFQPSKHGADLLASEDDGEPFRPLGSDHVLDLFERAIHDDPVQKEQSAKRLVLGGGRHVFLVCQGGEKRRHLGLAHLQRVPFSVEQDELLDPENVSLLGTNAVMEGPDRVPDRVEELGLRSGSDWYA